MPLEVFDRARACDVGVIVGRFQVPRLHSEHIELIRTVKERHLRTLIFLGTPQTRVTKRDPLEFKLRRQMLAEVFPDIDDVYYVFDHPDDEIWSKKLDQLISHHVGEHTAVLYGSRDSFISHYHGRYPTLELIPQRNVSGTELRRVTANVSRASEDFRAGIIYATEQQYSHPWTTIDVAILNEDNTKVLLGHKASDPAGKVRFIGGFVRTGLAPVHTLERNVRAEAAEETHAEISEPKYIGSAVIDDWRYRNDENKIMTVFFAAKHVFGAVQADDDIESVQWVELAKLKPADFVDGHVVLHGLLTAWLEAGNRV